MVVPVGDIEVVGCIERQPCRLVQASQSGQASVTEEASDAVSRVGADHSRGHVDAPHAIAVPLTEIDVAERVYRDRVVIRLDADVGARREAAVPGVSEHASAGYRGDDTGAGIDAPDAMVVDVGDEDVVRAVHGNTRRQAEARVQCGSPFSGKIGGAIACNGGDERRRPIDESNSLVHRVGDEVVTGRFRSNSLGGLEARRNSRTAVAGEPASCSRNGRDEARPNANAANAVVGGVGDEEISTGIERDTVRLAHHRGRGRPAVPRETERARAREPRDDARPAVHPSHFVVERIGDEERSRVVDGDSRRPAQAGRGRLPAVTGASCQCRCPRPW